MNRIRASKHINIIVLSIILNVKGVFSCRWNKRMEKKKKKEKIVERGVKLEKGGEGNFGVAQKFSFLAH